MEKVKLREQEQWIVDFLQDKKYTDCQPFIGDLPNI